MTYQDGLDQSRWSLVLQTAQRVKTAAASDSRSCSVISLAAAREYRRCLAAQVDVFLTLNLQPPITEEQSCTVDTITISNTLSSV